MKKILLLICILCANRQAVFSQTESTEDPVQTEEVYSTDTDSSSNETEWKQPILRFVSADSIAAIKKQKGFEYMQYIDSFFRNKKQLIQKDEAAEKEETSPGIFENARFRVFYWGLAFGLVIWLLWRLFIGSNALFSRNKKTKNKTTEIVEEVASGNQLENLLENAIIAKDFRLATRYLFLQTIWLLGEKQLLHVAPQKTNYQYVQELNGNTMHAAFSKLAMQYEYAWFGGFKIAQQQFDEIYKGYKELMLMIDSG